MTVLRSQISWNAATLSGGGLHNFGSTLNVRDTSITGNMSPNAAGVDNAYYGYISLQRSVISGNIASANGGGLRNDGTAVVEESQISGNEAATGAGIYDASYSYLSVVRSTISGNTATGSGGGIFGDSATTYLLGSTVSGNTGTYGGGLYIAGFIYYNTRVTNATISGNTATVSGGGIYNFGGSAFVEFSTITDNQAPDFSGSGIATQHPTFAKVEMYSSIVAGNDHTDVALTAEINAFISLGYNLVGTLGEGVDTFVELGDQVIGTDDPLLSPLADHGGPTMTHALLADSPAIDAGDPDAEAGVIGVPLVDQRGEGFGRVRDGDAEEDVAIDIGAFEVQQFNLPPPLLGDYNGDETVNAADYTSWRNKLGQAGLTPYSGADGDGDGVVTRNDYQVWKDHYGESLMMGVGSGEEAAADVPSPGSPATDVTIARAQTVSSVGVAPAAIDVRPTGSLRSVDVIDTGDARLSAFAGQPLTATAPSIQSSIRSEPRPAVLAGADSSTRDKALLAWSLAQSTTEEHHSVDGDPSSTPPHDDAASADDQPALDAIDRAFGWLAAVT